MSRDLDQLLLDTAVVPSDLPDPSELVARGRRRRLRRHVAGAVAGAAAAILVGVAVLQAVPTGSEPEILNQPPGAGQPATDGSTDVDGAGSTDGDAVTEAEQARLVAEVAELERRIAEAERRQAEALDEDAEARAEREAALMDALEAQSQAMEERLRALQAQQAAGDGAADAPAGLLPGLPRFPVTLELPPSGGVAAAHVGERPVFVIHRDDGEVLVLDAISPHVTQPDLPKVVAFCLDPWIFQTDDDQTVVATPGVFRDLWHGALFALDGAYLGGPAPTGLPGYRVQATAGDTVTIGPPGPAPGREVDPFEAVLGPGPNGRPLDAGTTDCGMRYDHQNRDLDKPDDQTAVVWHEPTYPDRWRYPFNPAGEPVAADGNVEPVLPGEQGQPGASREGVALAAIAVVLAFISALAAGAVYLRRREADGPLDTGASSVSRPGWRRLLDFGRGGWSEDGKNQPPRD